MSVSTGARKGISEENRISDSLKHNEQDLIQRMKPFNIQAPGLGPSASGEEISNKPFDIGDAWEEAAAQVKGIFAMFQKGAQLVDEAVTVVRTQTDEFASSFIEVTNAITDDILDIIDGGDYNGQILKIRIPDGINNFVIHNANKVANLGNIFMAGLDDLIIQGGDVVEFIYDTLTTPPAGLKLKSGASLQSGAVPGVWRLSGGATPSGTGAIFILGLINDQLGDGPIEWDENFDFPSGQTDIIDEGQGRFRLAAGAFYQLGCAISSEMSAGGSGSSALLQWTSSTTLNGVYTQIPNPQARFGVINTGRADFSTLPHASALVDVTGAELFVRIEISTVTGTYIATLNGTSSANIEKVSAGGGGGGGGGGGEDNTASNLIDPDTTNQKGLFAQKAGVDLQFKVLNAGTGVTLDADALQVTINADAATNFATRELDNLTSTLINADLIPNASAFINLGIDSPNQEWQNLFIRRVRFPTSSSIIADEVNFANVNSDLVFNAPSGRRILFDIAGFPQVELTTTELTLASVNMDVDQNQIFNTGILKFSFGGQSEDITTANIRQDGGTELRYTVPVVHEHIWNIGSTRFMTLDNQHLNVRGAVLPILDGSFNLGEDSPTDLRWNNLFMVGDVISSGGVIRMSGSGTNLLLGDLQVAGTTLLAGQIVSDLFMGTSNRVVIQSGKVEFTNTIGRLDYSAFSTNVGASGGASPLPANPLGYFLFQLSGIDVKVPFYNT